MGGPVSSAGGGSISSAGGRGRFFFIRWETDFFWEFVFFSLAQHLLACLLDYQYTQFSIFLSFSLSRITNMPSSTSPSAEEMHTDEVPHGGEAGTSAAAEEDFSDLDMVTRADLDSLALSIEIKMKANNDALLAQIQALVGGTSSLPPAGLAEIASAFQPNVTPEPFSGTTKERTKEIVDTWLHRWLVHFQFHPYIDEKKIQLAVGFLSGKALLWWKELTPQPLTWTAFEEAFRKEFLKKEADYDIVGKFKRLDMTTMNLKFEDYLQKFRDLRTRATKMDKNHCIGVLCCWFTRCLSVADSQ